MRSDRRVSRAPIAPRDHVHGYALFLVIEPDVSTLLRLGVATRLSSSQEARVWDAAARATKFFMGTADVQKALEKLVTALEHARIPYAIVGAMALNELGYERVTTDVDVLLTREGLAKFKSENLGRGYVESSKGVRDVDNNVNIDVLIAGDFPGDGKPKPVAFPDPAQVAVRGARLALLPVEGLVELKLASGMTAPHRLKDLADVIELVRHAELPRELGDRLDASVRAKYVELWEAAQASDDE
jgi:hypothetical protein